MFINIYSVTAKICPSSKEKREIREIEYMNKGKSKCYGPERWKTKWTDLSCGCPATSHRKIWTQGPLSCFFMERRKASVLPPLQRFSPKWWYQRRRAQSSILPSFQRNKAKWKKSDKYFRLILKKFYWRRYWRLVISRHKKITRKYERGIY